MKIRKVVVSDSSTLKIKYSFQNNFIHETFSLLYYSEKKYRMRHFFAFRLYNKKISLCRIKRNSFCWFLKCMTIDILIDILVLLFCTRFSYTLIKKTIPIIKPLYPIPSFLPLLLDERTDQLMRSILASLIDNFDKKIIEIKTRKSGNCIKRMW